MVENDRVWVAVQDEPLDVDAAADFLRHETAGGVDLFLGTTRRWTGSRETDRLEYESYAPMAVEEMRRIADEAAERWPVVRACLLHRVGEVALREISVIVGVSTPHRRDAFEACRFLIDELKRRVPIWKRERYTDGSTEWVQGDGPTTARS
jgi:molybdopterin synthase catalytic subunit